MKYKAVCTFYATARVVAGEDEMEEWSRKLNKHCEQGWRVKNSGAVPDGGRIVFWALLAKPGKLDLTND